MKTSQSLKFLGALSLLSLAAAQAMAGVDTSNWKCESCPFEQGTHGTLDVGVTAVSPKSAKFGEYNGLYQQGASAVLGGEVRYRGANDMFGSLSASDLGLETRTLVADGGKEGLYALRFAYTELPHRLSDSASTPFLGSGGAGLTLPAGFPAADTSGMPLAASLQPVDLGFKRQRYDLSASLLGGERWTYRLSLRHEVKDGTQRASGSFFANAAQLVMPVDQVTDQIELSTHYNGSGWQASLAYQGSLFRNGPESLTWANPFNPVSGGAAGQLALAPDNQFHQLIATAGHDFNASTRASAEVALGRMTQNANYLASTLNTALAVPALPATSLNGTADTLNLSLRLSAAPIERMRLNASYTRDERDNNTASGVYPLVSTDMFLGGLRANQAYSFSQDRFKLSADYRFAKQFKASVGAEENDVKRTSQEVATTRETTVWARADTQFVPNLHLSLNLAHAERTQSGYSALAWMAPAENPLLRKFNLADRVRDSGRLRADLVVMQGLQLGFDLGMSNDDYTHSSIGLLAGHSLSYGADVSAALSEDTSLHAFAQAERIRSRQAGSQTYALPDWSGRNDDAVDVAGVGIKHQALKGKLELGADLTYSRSRGEVSVDNGSASPAFPASTSGLDTVRLHAMYRLKDNLSLIGSYWYESYEAQDWRLNGLLPATVPNFLALGEQVPRYHANLVSLALRYRF